MRWREEIESKVMPARAWTADARLDAVIATAAMDEVGKDAWCRAHGVVTTDLDKWRATATSALDGRVVMRASAQSTRDDRLRIRELECNLLRKNRALAEMAAPLVLSKKVAAIVHNGESE